MMKFSLLMLGSMFLLYCSPTVEPITFGDDQCTFCKMSIVDKRYGAEVLTTKGKVFKYDALECMINALCENMGHRLAIIIPSARSLPGQFR